MKKFKVRIKKSVSVFMAFIMVVTMMPQSTFAEGETANDISVIVTADQIPKDATVRLQFKVNDDTKAKYQDKDYNYINREGTEVTDNHYNYMDDDGYMNFRMLDNEKTNMGTDDGVFLMTKDSPLASAFSNNVDYPSQSNNSLEDNQHYVKDDDDETLPQCQKTFRVNENGEWLYYKDGTTRIPANAYKGSTIQDVCEGVYADMAEEVQNNVIPTSLTQPAYTPESFEPPPQDCDMSELDNDHVFLLSGQEADTYFSVKNEMGEIDFYHSDENRKLFGVAREWWLRCGMPTDYGWSMSIAGSGSIDHMYDDNSDFAVACALNLKKDAFFEKTTDDGEDVYSFVSASNLVKVTFQNDDGSDYAVKYTIKGKGVELPDNPQKEGYTFDHWDGSLDNIQSDTTVKAVYTENTYDINLYENYQGTSEPDTIADIPYTQKIKISDSVNPAQTGYLLKEWNEDPDGRGKYYGPDEEISGLVSENKGYICSYAIWQENDTYTVNYDTEGGSPIESKTHFKWNDSNLLPKYAPTRSGYVFDCWCVDKDRTIMASNDTTYESVAVKDKPEITLYARWNKCSNISDVNVTLKDGKSYKYKDGEAIEPEVKATTSDGNDLILDQDYVVDYYDNIYPGNAVAIVRGVNNYTNSICLQFKIDPPKVDGVKNLAVTNTTMSKVKLAWSKQSKADGYYIYKDGGNKPVATLKSAGSTNTTISNLTAGKVYKFQIQAYIKLPNGAIYTSAKSNAKIGITVPEKVSISKVTSKSKTVTATWGAKNCTGYEIQISTSSKFTKILKKATVKSSTRKLTFSKLKTGTKYYVRVRAVAKSGTSVKNGEWSKILSVKCK